MNKSEVKREEKTMFSHTSNLLKDETIKDKILYVQF